MDQQLLLWINHDWANPLFDWLLWWVSQPLGFSLPLALLLLADCWRRQQWAGVRLFLVMAVSIGLGDALGNLLKDLFSDPRPCFVLHEQLRSVHGQITQACGAASTGMPSNHTLNFFVAASFIGITTRWRAWQLGLLGIALLVGLSRIYLGKHYPSQVLVGGLIGASLGILCGWLAHHFRARLALPPQR